MLDTNNMVLMSDGNPGAMRFIVEAYRYNADKCDRAFDKMKKAGIVGERLYMIWNDCCDRNTEMAVNIILTHEIDDIVKHINYENGRGIPYTSSEA